jgi:moderate conductance mechanosensitive channel
MTVLPQWLRQFANFIGSRGLRVATLILLAFVLVRILRALTSRLVHLAKSDREETPLHNQRARTLAGLLFSVGTLVIFSLTALEILREAGFDVTPVAAAAGLASLAVGFGAQNLVRDFINGFVIVFEDQYAVGDLVRINDVSGRVSLLTLRRTVVQTDQGAVITIPNGLIGQVANLNRKWLQEIVSVTLPADEEVGRALALMEKAVQEFRADSGWAAAIVEGPRILGVDSVSPQGTTLSIAARAVPGRHLEVARELRRRIRLAFEDAGVRVTDVRRVETARVLEQNESGRNNSREE